MKLETFAKQIHDWHAKKVAHINAVADKVKAGTVIRLGDEPDASAIEATKREALFFRLGCEAALAELGTLPFSITRADKAR